MYIGNMFQHIRKHSKLCVTEHLNWKEGREKVYDLYGLNTPFIV